MIPITRTRLRTSEEKRDIVITFVGKCTQASNLKAGYAGAGREWTFESSVTIKLTSPLHLPMIWRTDDARENVFF